VQEEATSPPQTAISDFRIWFQSCRVDDDVVHVSGNAPSREDSRGPGLLETFGPSGSWTTFKHLEPGMKNPWFSVLGVHRGQSKSASQGVGSPQPGESRIHPGTPRQGTRGRDWRDVSYFPVTPRGERYFPVGVRSDSGTELLADGPDAGEARGPRSEEFEAGEVRVPLENGWKVKPQQTKFPKGRER
jgi:hypothetical protein